MNTSVAAEHAQRRRESLQRLVEPLREQLTEIDAQLLEVEDTRHQLQLERRELLSVIRAADPEERAKTKPGPKLSGKKTKRAGRVDQVARQIEEWLNTHGLGPLGPEGITQTGLNRVLTGASPATIGPALEQLAEQGTLRLDHLTRGGGRAYALVNGDSAP